MNCTRPLDPLDLEALASGEAPVVALDAPAHAAGCADCARRLEAFRALGEWLSDLSVPPVPDGFAEGIERLRGFSAAEALSWRIWKAPALAFAGFLTGSAALLALPALGAGDQAGLLSALALEWRSLLLWPVSLARAVPAAATAVSDVLLRDRAFAAASILLLLPAAFAVTRLWARRAIRR
ncbi:MAG TPA: hypothetical protein VFL12_02610 [Thermoanaerobaculia bacterium]|nr:hypothetical protein [Thermoanaerobaculia bacterium]